MVIAGTVPSTGGQDHPLETFLKYAEPFVCGGTGGVMATTLVQPIDTVKVRLQVLGEGKTNFKLSPLQITRDLVAKEGVGALYTGLQAAWLRQVMYGATRLGMFHSLSNMVKAPGEGTIPVYKKIACGITAGGIGAFVGNPADLALTRMQADATLPAAQQRKYTGVFNAIQRIMREEGVKSLWRGALPTISRAAAVTAGQMATYDTTKKAVAPRLGGEKQNKEAWPVRIFAACCSGGVAAVAGLPFDMTKTRMMRQTADASGRMPYTNMLDCARQIVSKEGPLALWTGLPTFLVRLAPHTILTLLFMDMILPRYRSGREAATQWLHAETMAESAH